MSLEIGRGWAGSASQLGEAKALSALAARPNARGDHPFGNWRYEARLRYDSVDRKGLKRKFRLTQFWQIAIGSSDHLVAGR